MLMIYGWIGLTILAVVSALTTIFLIGWFINLVDERNPTTKDFTIRWICIILGIMVTFSLAFGAWACNHYAYYA